MLYCCCMCKTWLVLFCYFMIGQETWHEVTSEHSRPCQSKCAICFCRMKTRRAYFPFYPSWSHVVHCSPDFLLDWRCGVRLAMTDCAFVCLEWTVSTNSRHGGRKRQEVAQDEAGRKRERVGLNQPLSVPPPCQRVCLSAILCVRLIERAKGATAPFMCLC